MNLDLVAVIQNLETMVAVPDWDPGCEIVAGWSEASGPGRRGNLIPRALDCSFAATKAAVESRIN